MTKPVRTYPYITELVREALPAPGIPFSSRQISDDLWTHESLQHIPEPEFPRVIAQRLIHLRVRGEIAIKGKEHSPPPAHNLYVKL